MSKILVTGSTGNLGTAVIQHLLKLTDKQNIVAFARDAEKAKKISDQGIEVRIGNYNDVASIQNALKGIEKFLLISGIEGNRLQQHKNVVDAAAKAGVKFLAYTSVAHVDVNKSQITPFFKAHTDTEEHIKKSGIPYAILRNTLYSEGILKLSGGKAIEVGLHMPGGDGKVPYVSISDLAEATAKILTNEKDHLNQTYNFTGEQVSFGQIASILSEIAGKEVKYNDLEPSTFPDLLKQFQVPDHIQHVIIGFVTDTRNHLFEINDNSLEKILGRKPTSLKETLKENIKA